MTRCPTCHLRKPDALFTTVLQDRGKCLNCRATGGRLKPRKHDKSCASIVSSSKCDCLHGRKIRTIQADPIKPTKHDKVLIKFAKREMKDFKRRGAPEVERPYSYIGASSDKGMVSRKLYTRT